MPEATRDRRLNLQFSSLSLSFSAAFKINYFSWSYVVVEFKFEIFPPPIFKIYKILKINYKNQGKENPILSRSTFPDNREQQKIVLLSEE